MYFSLLPGILLLNIQNKEIFINKIRKVFIKISYIVIFYVLIKNFTMVYENYYKENYSIRDNFITLTEYETIKYDNLQINFPFQENSCENITPLCVKYKYAFLSSNYDLLDVLNYVIVTNKRLF